MSVYKILDNTNGNCYIGSSKHYCIRKYAHINIYHESVSSKSIIENGNFTFSILEDNIKENLKEREQYYINNSVNCINKRKAYRTHEEKKIYNLQDMNKRREYHKTWGGDKRYHNNLLLIDVNLFL